MMKIGLLCPTKSRPDDVIRLIRSLERTTSDLNNITLYLGVDADDETIEKYIDHVRLKSYVEYITIPVSDNFIGLGKIWNIMARAVGDDILSMIGDDMVFETYGWDRTVLKRFNTIPDDKLLLVHCNDGIHGPGNKYPEGRLQAVNSFIHRTYVDVTGHYTCEQLKHQYLDTWLDDVYSCINRKVYLPDVMIRHLHFSQTGIVDQVTKKLRANSPPMVDKVKYNKLKPARDVEINKLNEHIKNTTFHTM